MSETSGAIVPQGDDKARADFIELHLPLVERVAECLMNRAGGREKLRGLEREDLLQEGTIGLIHAVDTFDDTRGVNFDQYVRMCIANEIRRAIRENCNIEVAPLDDELEAPADESTDAKLLVEQLLPQLPDTQRDVIRLHYLEDIPQVEIARQLGISHQAVSQRIQNGLSTLRRLADQ